MSEKRDMQRLFWARLEQALKERDMQASDLATRLETSRATVSEWKVRGSWPTGYILIQIAKALRVNVHWLLTGDGGMELPGRAAPADEALVQRGFNLALAQVEVALSEIRANGKGRAAAPTASPPPDADEALRIAALAPPAQSSKPRPRGKDAQSLPA